MCKIRGSARKRNENHPDSPLIRTVNPSQPILHHPDHTSPPSRALLKKITAMPVDENAVLAAIADFKAGTYTSHEAAARAYGISGNTLRIRIRGETKPKADAHKHNRLISDGQANAVIDWVGKLTSKGYPPSYELIQARLNAVHRAKNPGAEDLGVNYTYRFVERYPDVLGAAIADRRNRERTAGTSAKVYRELCDKVRSIPILYHQTLLTR